MKATRLCSIDGCDRKHYCRGYCTKHYGRLRAHGDAEYRGPRQHEPFRQRFMQYVEHDQVTGCWLWTGFIDSMGYAKSTRGNGSEHAHRIAYEEFIGPIPEGKHLDHLCRNRRCVNPKHLEPVTPQENTLRSPVAPAAINARKTHCIRGHRFDASNTYINARGNRICRACQALHQQAYLRRKAAA